MLAWFEEVFADEEKTYTVCESYRLHRKNAAHLTGSLRQYPVLEVKACMMKETGTDYRGEGEMMNKRRWIQWSTDSLFCMFIQCLARCCLPNMFFLFLFICLSAFVVFGEDPNQCTYPKVLQLQEADAQWNKWEMERETDRSIFWMMLDHVLHIRISVRYTMDFRTSSTRQNRAEALIKSIKRADSSKLAEEANKLGTGMESFGDMNVDMHAEAFAMVKSGADPQSAFADLAASIPDVTSMLTKKKKKGDGQGDEGDEGSEDALEDDEPEKAKRGDPTWWAREEYILATETELEALVTADALKIERGFRELLKTHQAACLHSM